MSARVMDHRLARGAATIARAVARHGWRGVASKIIADIRIGGLGLVLRKFRIQYALLPMSGASSIDGARGRACPAPVQAPRAPKPSQADDTSRLILADRYSLPVADFERFVGDWRRHPAMAPLLGGEHHAEARLTIVVSPHAVRKFNDLALTLSSVADLARQTDTKPHVVLYAPTSDQPVQPRLDVGICITQAASVPALRNVLAAEKVALVQFLQSGDLLPPAYAGMVTSPQLSKYDVILTDMYFQDGADNVGLILLPGINPVHALNADYFLSRAIVRAGTAIRALDRDITDVRALVVTLICGEDRQAWRCRSLHIAFPLLFIAETQASLLERRMQLLGRTEPLRLRCNPTLERAMTRRVSVVICTKNNGFLLEQLISRLACESAGEISDIVVVSNRPTNAYAAQLHERLASGGQIKLVNYDAPFNFSSQCNLGAAAGGGDVLLFLNDDVVPVNRDWLRELIEPLDDPGIGIVGPLLLYPNGSVQHAGMFLGFERVAGHSLRGVHLPEGDCGFLGSAPRQVMSVTGAALCMRRHDFEALNGFDHNRFALNIQDVDLCLRAHFSGLAVIFNPRSIFLHMESVSVRPTLDDLWAIRRRALEHDAFAERWGDVIERDEFHNPNFCRSVESLKGLVCPGSE
jgi:GT2 family glycosyltransferase